MGTGLLLTFLAFTAAVVVTGEPLKKEVLNLPPLIHFTDVFNTQSDLVHDELSELSGRPPYSGGPYRPPPTARPPYPKPSGGPTYPTQTGIPHYIHPQYQHPHYTGPYYPQYSGIPQYPGVPQYPPSRPYPGNPQPTYGQYPPYPQYPQHPSYPQYPQYPQYPKLQRPRQQDVELVERYCKFNEDGSKEYKLVLSNGLTIYQKMMNKNDDKQEIQVLEGYYSDQRDNDTYLNTYFRADDNGYTASSEISDTPPNYPDTKDMLSLPLPPVSSPKADSK